MKFTFVVLLVILLGPALVGQDLATYEKNPDQLPLYDGGQSGYFKFIGKNIKYPKSARIKGLTGKIFVSFTVDKSGKVKDIAVNQNEDRGQVLEEVVVVAYGSSGSSKKNKEKPDFPPFLEEGERVINLISFSESGTKDGNPVATRMTQPIFFKLN